MKKKILCMLTAFIYVFSACVSASTLGTVQVYGYNYEIGDGLTLYENAYIGDQEGVGRQTENYFLYSPNEATRPVVTLGQSVYKGEDINEIYEYLSDNGVRTVGGANGDFYSVSTGVPNGHVVINKKIVSLDNRVLPALGIKDDGTAFIDDFSVEVKMLHNDTETVIPFINKYLQKWGYYMYDSDYYEKITPDAMGKYVTFEIKEGEMKIGETLTCELISIEDSIENKEIGENEIIIALTYEADPVLAEVFEAFIPGDTVEFTFSSNNDEVWEEAEYILASDAGRILQDGEYVGSELAGASPRTAVGIKENGEMILYTVDGRQQGHSYGVRIPTLANRLKELGCTDVLNLDGGGSTTISAIYGGTEDFSLLNSPSDGKPRNNSTYIFFENLTPYTGETAKLFLYPHTVYAKSGAKVNYELKASDGGYFMTEAPEDAEYFVDGESYIDENGGIYAMGDETATVTAEYDGITATAYLKSVETPDRLKITDENGNEITEISLEEGQTLDLNIIAYHNEMELVSTDELYTWEVTEESGSITETGEFTMGSESGKITVTAGELKAEIPVWGDAFSDISGNWARHYINGLYDEGVVNGFLQEDGSFVFKPGNFVTKSEMAVMLAKTIKPGVNEVVSELPFEDADEIPDWALPYVKALYSAGIINGSLADDGKVYFYPAACVNRAEIFTIIGRVLDAKTENPCPFSDREEIPVWAVSYIDALYEKGMVNGYEDNELKVYNNITRAEISKIIVKALYN